MHLGSEQFGDGSRFNVTEATLLAPLRHRPHCAWVQRPQTLCGKTTTPSPTCEDDVDRLRVARRGRGLGQPHDRSHGANP